MMMLLMLSAILHVSTYVECNANTDALVNSIFNQPPPPPATNNLPQGLLEGTGLIDIALQSENVSMIWHFNQKIVKFCF